MTVLKGLFDIPKPQHPQKNGPVEDSDGITFGETIVQRELYEIMYIFTIPHKN